jgi:hypothetical protein
MKLFVSVVENVLKDAAPSGMGHYICRYVMTVARIVMSVL